MSSHLELPFDWPRDSGMSPTTAGLIALGILVLFALIVLALGCLSETGHGSRVNDLRELLAMLDSAKTRGRKALILGWYLRAILRAGYYGAVISTIGALTAAAAAMFGGGWEIARQMLCHVLRFVETIVRGKAISCEPVAAQAPLPPTTLTPL